MKTLPRRLILAIACMSICLTVLGEVLAVQNNARFQRPNPFSMAMASAAQRGRNVVSRNDVSFATSTDYGSAPSHEPAFNGYAEQPVLGGGYTNCDCCPPDACCGSCDSCCCGGCSPWWAHRSLVFGEFLYLSPSDAEVNHAQQQNGTGGAGTVPYGLISAVDPDFEPGFRTGFAYALSGCSSLGGSYSYFESHTATEVDPPVIPGGGGAVESFVHHPGAQITASVGPVTASYDVDFQLADIEYRALWKGNSRWAINWSVGARYGHLEQDFRQQGVFSGGSAGVLRTRTNVDFDGGGLRFGVDGERRLGCGGFSIYGRSALSPTSGRFHADYTLTNESTQVLLANAVWQDDRIITMLDLEAGLSWTGPCGRWKVSSGYVSSYWFNTLTTAEFIDAVQANSYDNAADTLTFDGFTARIERRW